MYCFQVVHNGKVLASRTFRFKRDIIRFTGHKISYNDFKPRRGPKKYRTYKDFFVIKKI